ncbi:MAG: serine hydrolase domain-containing protein [Pseudomonadota bacterium]
MLQAQWTPRANRKCRSAFALAAVTMLMSVAYADEVRPPMIDQSEFESLFESAISDANKRLAYGAVLALDGAAELTATKGPIHRGSKEPVGSDVPWHIGSISKSVTATLLLQLVSEGVLSLDAPLAEYLEQHAGEMHVDWRAQTLRGLLSHTAGLPANVSQTDLGGNWPDDLTLARKQILERYWTEPLGDRPGDFQYSNLGYVLAGFVAEDVTGKGWEQLVMSRIAEPLGLNTLCFGAPVTDGSPWGHSRFLGFLSAADPNGGGTTDNPAWMAPAGGLHMSLDDLVAWGEAHLRACKGQMPHFLAADLCRTMQTPLSDEYGLGWIIQQLPDSGQKIVWHNGSNTMWYAILVIMPDKDAVLAIAHNSGDAKPVDALARAIIERVMNSR